MRKVDDHYEYIEMYSTRILDSDYIPETEEDQELFKATNDYMLSVFDKKLMTSQATAAIHALAKKPYPAQKIWKSVRKHNEESTTASMQSSQLITYLTGVKWNSPEYRWKGGSEAFIRHYCDKIREYEDMNTPDIFSNDFKLNLLQETISTHPQAHPADG